MSGDCGHGWGYHLNGPGSPCSKCQQEERLERSLLSSMSQEAILKLLTGMIVKADHPITVLNPTETFEVIDVNIERGKLFLRGKDTMWFEAGMLTRIDK